MHRVLKMAGLDEKSGQMVETVFRYLLGKWYVLLLVTLIGAGIGYWMKKRQPAVFTATYSFVLSTEGKSGGGVSGIASQFGLDLGNQSGSESMFSGDNIIELFNSNRMLNEALLYRIDSTQQTLANFIAKKTFTDAASLAILPLPDDPLKMNPGQVALMKKISQRVSKDFVVYKKDKKLIFYVISASSSDPQIAFYIAKFMLNQTARYFIETKTRVATKGMELLQKEADSIGNLLGTTFKASAAITDRSFNINPSIQVQRSEGLLNQAKSTALAAAYTEVIKNLEIAKINIQKETPLYRIIDEPSLPLESESKGTGRFMIIIALSAFAVTLLLLTLTKLITLYK